jgi:hypothetical protein
MAKQIFDTVGLIVAFFVSAVVWGTLAAGLYQLVRQEIHRIRITSRQSRPKRTATRPVEA